MSALVFYPFAGLAVLGALGVITFRRPSRALLSLMVTMFALAVLFVQLKAPFVATVYLVVYAGAVLVLFLFVIMLLGLGSQELKIGQVFRKIYLWVSIFVPAAWVGLFVFFILQGLQDVPEKALDGSPKAFGSLLFTRYILPFELVSFLLLIGVFAAVALAARNRPEQGS